MAQKEIEMPAFIRWDYLSGDQMTSLILVFVIGMTILTLQFARELHHSRNKAMLSDINNAKPTSGNRNKFKSFGIDALIRAFHLDQAEHLLQKKFTGRKA